MYIANNLGVCMCVWVFVRERNNTCVPAFAHCIPLNVFSVLQELVIALQRTGDPGQLSSLRPQLELLAALDPAPDAPPPGWKPCAEAMEAVRAVVTGLVHFIQHHGNRKLPDAHHPHNAKYKTSMCRDLTQRSGCPRGNNCTFAHSEEELEKYRNRSRKHGKGLAPPLTAPAIKTSAQHLTVPAAPLTPHPPTGVEAKNGEHAPPTGPVPKATTVEELLQVGDIPPPAAPLSYEAHKFVHLPAHTQSLPVLPAPTPTPAIIQPALAPAPFHPTPVAEYTYSSFHCQPPVFAQAAPPQQPLPSAPTAAVFPGQATAIVPDLYGGNPPTMLLNTAPVYNVTGHTNEYCIPIANTKPTNSGLHPLVSCWPDTSCATFCVTTSPSTTSSLTPAASIMATKSIEELKERKEAIMNQLETIVGKEATHQMATQIANGEELSKPQEFTSTYSIWTSGADFYIAPKGLEKPYEPVTGYRTFAARKEEGKGGKDDFIPFDPPLVSRFGPISRMSRTVIQPANPIQSSVSSATETTTTPTVRRPVPAISPMPQVTYCRGGWGVFFPHCSVCYTLCFWRTLCVSACLSLFFSITLHPFTVVITSLHA